MRPTTSLVSRLAGVLLLGILLASTLALPAAARPAASYRIVDLGTLDGQSEARGINDRGQVVGTSVARDGRFHGFV
jgi:hypothetical protein